MTRAAECAAGVARTSGCWRVELVAAMPRVDCPRCGVVVASVPWAEPGSRFTRDFEVFCFNVCSTGSAVFFRSVG